MRLFRICLLLLIFIFPACTPQAGGPLVAVILPESDGLRDLQDGMRAAARENGARVWFAKPPDDAGDAAGKINEALKQQPSALVISPPLTGDLTDALRQATMSGLPVICLESCAGMPDAAVTLLPGPNRDAGDLAGGLALDTIAGSPAGSTVLVVLECTGDTGCSARSEAFINRLPQNIVISRLAPNTDRAALEQLLLNSQAVRLVYAAGKEETLVALDVMRAHNLRDRIVLIGYGLDQKTASQIGKDGLLAISAGLSYQAGYDTLSTALMAARGEAIPSAMRKNAILFTTGDDRAAEFLSLRGRNLLPTVPPMPDFGAGIKPSCNCGPETKTLTPTPVQ